MTAGASALPAAVLWDMDGTLLDTEPLWHRGETATAAEFGVEWTEDDGRLMTGSAMSVTAAAMQARGVPLTVDEIADRLNGIVAAGVAAAPPWTPGALELITRLAELGVPQALVTSSYRVLADPFAAVVGHFGAVVAAEDVTAHKPDPEPYLLAAQRLGVDPELCVAVEDSVSGLASATASGARVLAVRTPSFLGAVPGMSVTDGLDLVTVDILGRIGAGEVLDLVAQP